MGQISRLQLTETVWIHAGSVKILQKNLGFSGSQDVIERAVFEISERLGQLEKYLLDDDLSSVRKIAKSLVGISAQIGLLLFSKVAADIVICADRNDRVGMISVAGRLLRISDASLYAAVDTSDSNT